MTEESICFSCQHAEPLDINVLVSEKGSNERIKCNNPPDRIIRNLGNNITKLVVDSMTKLANDEKAMVRKSLIHGGLYPLNYDPSIVIACCHFVHKVRVQSPAD